MKEKNSREGTRIRDTVMYTFQKHVVEEKHTIKLFRAILDH